MYYRQPIPKPAHPAKDENKIISSETELCIIVCKDNQSHPDFQHFRLFLTVTFPGALLLTDTMFRLVILLEGGAEGGGDHGAELRRLNHLYVGSVRQNLLNEIRGKAQTVVEQ